MVLASEELEPVFEHRRKFFGMRSLGAYDTVADGSDEDDELLPALAFGVFFSFATSLASFGKL
jgi:hypothetical protein